MEISNTHKSTKDSYPDLQIYINQSEEIRRENGQRYEHGIQRGGNANG